MKKMAAENYLVSMGQWGFLKKQSETNTNPVSLVARQELRTLYAQAAN